MPILAGIQRRSYRVGQIKAGDKEELDNGKIRPRRLDGFRFTTPSADRAREVADLYKGDEPRRWGQQWEVYTKATEIDVALPPGALVINQAMMRWSGGGPAMVCDGVRTTRPVVGPCQCPQPDDPSDQESLWAAIRERRRLAGQKTPAGCYPYTWLNLCLVDIGDFGVWQLLSKSENAAAEIIQKAVLLERARASGQFLPAKLALEYRESRVDGLLRQYNVPALRVDESIRAIAEGALADRPLAEQLPPAPAGRARITAGASARALTSTPHAPAAGGQAEPEDEVVDAEFCDEEDGSGAGGAGSRDASTFTAKDIAALAAAAETTADIDQLAKRAVANHVENDNVCTDEAAERWEALMEYLRRRWRELSTGQRAA